MIALQARYETNNVENIAAKIDTKYILYPIKIQIVRNVINAETPNAIYVLVIFFWWAALPRPVFFAGGNVVNIYSIDVRDNIATETIMRSTSVVPKILNR